MGAYNCERTLRFAIESIIHQTYQNWEFIICDDGSKDSTWQIIQEYTKKDARIIGIQNSKNLGHPATLNECFKRSSGSYLARQDADDLSVPHRLERQLQYLEEHPEVDVLSTDAFLCDENWKIWGEKISRQNLKLSDWARGSQINHASVLIRRSIFEKVNGYDSIAYRVEDYDLWLRMLAIQGKILTLPEKLYTIQWTQKDYIRKRRRDRLREVKYKIKGMLLNRMPFWSYVFVLKSFVLIMLPNFFIYKLHALKFKR